LLIVLYSKYRGSYPVGAIPVIFESQVSDSLQTSVEGKINPILELEQEKIDESLFLNDEQLFRVPEFNKYSYLKTPIIEDYYISKRTLNTAHMYPKLVGTLDKCKFVLNSQAIERGVFDDPKVSIFERDFIQKHIQMGILDPNRRFRMICELKYDGISVEAEVTDHVISARTRGDTELDVASDITPILEGYQFRHARGVVDTSKPFGMKFEAIITYMNMERIASMRSREYKNPRNTIIGLFGSSDARQFRDYITLVPLATSIEDVDRLTEVEFLNKYYNSGEYLRYVVIEGNYIEILFQVNKFVQEAEYMRSIIPFMYDGVVVSYIDDDLIKALGRENSVNKYSIAIKFNTMKKQTIFTGYSYTIGQNGIITPMINYNSVEFYGGVHTKSSGHSLNRFNSLQLKVGDIIDVEYVNDVMPYVTKPDNEHNRNNPNPPEQFITHCPECGSELIMSPSKKSIMCPNARCSGRKISRMVNMVKKLGFKGFSDEFLTRINKSSLNELFKIKKDELVPILGELTSQKFIDQVESLKNEPIFDYRIIGSLGFTNISIETWKLILKVISIEELVLLMDVDLYNKLVAINGIGPTIASTIINERELFFQDIILIQDMPNVIKTTGSTEPTGKVIRFSGIRDQILCDKLNRDGHDANDSAVTKKTDILIIPNIPGYTSSKLTKAISYGTTIVKYNDFVENPNKYLK
jgi:DNA ligase (NAD+)